MAGGYKSNRAAYMREFKGEIRKRVSAATEYLASQVRADISQPGTLRYHPIGKRGKLLKTQRTVYNFTHSRPGNPPFKQTGNLRMSIATEMKGLIGRVGSNIRKPAYPLYLEMGTKRMRPRPYLRRALMIHRAALLAILTKRIPVGGLPAIQSHPFRPGHFGRGARLAGWR